MTQSSRRILVDVSGLLHWYAYLRVPTGIQRVTERILATATIAEDPRITFVARVPGAKTFYEVDKQTIERLVQGSGRDATLARVRRIYADMLGAAPLRAVLPKQLLYLAMGRFRLASLLEFFVSGGQTRYHAPIPIENLSNQDLYVSLGDFWCHRDQASAIVRLKALYDVGIVQMIHDLFPVHYSKWDHPRFGTRFVEQLAALAPSVDGWLVNSQYVHDDLRRYLVEVGIPGGKIDTIRLGWDRPPAKAPFHDEDAHSLRRLGLRSDGYFMQVGTVEPRKNHEAVLRALGRLREKRGVQMPTCVFVGRDGWNSGDLQRQLTRRKPGESAVRWLKHVNDHDLAALYRGALFTVFPSYVEGWGLPVQESLSYGVPCIASNSGAIPEVGGDLALYFDPADERQLAACLDVYLSDPVALAGARKKIEIFLCDQGCLPTWSDAARAVIETVDAYAR